MQYVNDGLIACPAGAEYLQEFDRLIPHCGVIGIVVKLLLHDFIEHVFRDVTWVSDIDCHARDCSNAEVRVAPPRSGFHKPPRHDSAAQSPNAEYDQAYGDTGSPRS